MQIKYVDTHCHLQFEQYAEDRSEIVERMRSEGVAGIVVGIDLESSKRALAIAKEHEHLSAAVGLHPNYVDHERFDEAALHALAADPKVVAIGECGLDFFRPPEVNEKVKGAQREALRTHIRLAAEFDKPLIIHARPSKGTMDAYQDLILILKESKVAHPRLRGDIHFFVGGIPEANALIELGFTVSFTAVITFAREYDTVIRAVPLESMLSETDSPYVAPASRRGKRNDPLAVMDVVAKIAQIRGEDPERVRETLVANSRRLFSLS